LVELANFMRLSSLKGSISFITTDPTNSGFEFVVGERGGKRVLVIREGQHEYVFSETVVLPNLDDRR
jgi:hypothetical protein